MDHWNVIFGSSDIVNAVKFLVDSGPWRELGGVPTRPMPPTGPGWSRPGTRLESTVWPAECSSDIVENPQVSTMVRKVGYTVMPMGAAGGTPRRELVGIPQAAGAEGLVVPVHCVGDERRGPAPVHRGRRGPSRKSILPTPRSTSAI